MAYSYGWNRYCALARSVRREDIESKELEYKRDAQRLLRAVRDKLLDGDDTWYRDLMKSPLSAHLTNLFNWLAYIKLTDWFKTDTSTASEALRSLWAPDPQSSAQLPGRSQILARIRACSERIPRDVLAGTGTRLRPISTLLMAFDAETYPPFMTTLFDKAYKRMGYPRPPKDADEAALYEHSLQFLDEFIQEARARKLELRNRLEAQSVVYMLRDTDPDT